MAEIISVWLVRGLRNHANKATTGDFFDNYQSMGKSTIYTEIVFEQRSKKLKFRHEDEVPLHWGDSGVADTREDEDILRLTGRTKRMVGVFAKPAHSQDWAGFFVYWGSYCDTSRVPVQTRPKLWGK